MNNLPTVNLPAHLQAMSQNQGMLAINDSAAAGIASGSWPRISIKGCRFRLQHPNGDEAVVPQLFLDVIIVDANPNLSKTYYAKAYDPNGEDAAPDCYSDNGVGPSRSAAKPQCGTCAACPHNVWGSKITPSGSQVKACSDVKRVAVLIASNTSGPVFELRIPAASLKAFGEYINSLTKHGIPTPSVTTRIAFDNNAEFPKLTFQPAFTEAGQMPYITQEQYRDVMEVFGTDEVDVAIGKKDVAVDPAKAQNAAIAAPAQPAPQLFTNTAPVPPAAPLPSFPPRTNTAPAPAADAAAAPSAQPARTRRSRAKKAEESALPPAQAAGEAPPPFVRNMPQAAPANAVSAAAPLAAAPTSASIDDLIAAALKV